MDISNLEPKKFYKFFSELSAIPRGSGNEKAASDYVYNYAKSKGFFAVQDSRYNVIIRKPAAKGCENAPAVILQGHLDMVCEKNKDTEHDFLTQGINLVVDGEYVRAQGTTLGADNGVAVAYAMSVLDSDDIAHPPLEVLLTTGEEVGMFGAMALEPEHVTGKRMINMDSFQEGVFTVSCAGGLRSFVSLKPERESVNIAEGFVLERIAVTGLKGGHSGIDIDKERGNANRILGRLLNSLKKSCPVRIVSVNGGEKENAIPREAEAVVIIPSGNLQNASELFHRLADEIKREYRISDAGLTITLSKMDDTAETAFTQETSDRIIALLTILPNGPQNMNIELKGFVETSVNIGVVRTSETDVTMGCAIRSSVPSRKRCVADMIENAAALAGAEVATSGEYPSWSYDKDSALRTVCVDIFKEMYGREPELHAIHAGLECGVLIETNPGMDVIAIGPDVIDAHTPEERMGIASVQRCYEFLVKVLEKLSK